MTCRAGSPWPPVMLASPVGHPPRRRHSSSRPGPAARWMAPSTPPPPSSEALAALTMASTRSDVMSPRVSSSRSPTPPSSQARGREGSAPAELPPDRAERPPLGVDVDVEALRGHRDGPGRAPWRGRAAARPRRAEDDDDWAERARDRLVDVDGERLLDALGGQDPADVLAAHGHANRALAELGPAWDGGLAGERRLEAHGRQAACGDGTGDGRGGE